MAPIGIRGSCLTLAALAAVSGCGRSGSLEGEDAFAFVPDHGVIDPRPTATPTPLPHGDGHDGAYAPGAGTNRPTPCWRLVGTTGAGLALASGQGTTSVALEPGDVLFLHQTQGHLATSGDTTPIATTGTAGHWQLALVLDSGAGLVTVSPDPVFAFRSIDDARAQACLFPQHSTATIANVAVEAYPWDGDTGGIVGLFVQETLALDGVATIHADGRGFRGAVSQQSTGAFVDAFDTPAANAARKGEGIDRRSYTLHGKGNYANAGGGGNATDGGGGGGGGAGAGGLGGRTFNNADVTRRAHGGAALAPATDRIHFGGGGGAGQDNGGGGPGPGGPGGGVVFVAAQTMTGDATARLAAAGADGASNGNNGGGGGGGGGTVLFGGGGAGFSGLVDVRGGRGGNCNDNHGPGGGGGGGAIRVDTSLGGTRELAGGLNGVSTNTGARDATPGGVGTAGETD